MLPNAEDSDIDMAGNSSNSNLDSDERPMSIDGGACSDEMDSDEGPINVTKKHTVRNSDGGRRDCASDGSGMDSDEQPIVENDLSISSSDEMDSDELPMPSAHPAKGNVVAQEYDDNDFGGPAVRRACNNRLLLLTFTIVSRKARKRRLGLYSTVARTSSAS